MLSSAFLKAAILTVALSVSVAYSGGITYGHWIAQAFVDGFATTGSLDVEVTDPGTDFGFDCSTHLFPEKALSFVRFWSPDEDPGDLESRKPGAVKLEEDGNEVADGFALDPPDAQLGTGASVFLGPATVAITDWVVDPESPGEFVGFYYEVDGESVVVDVKAAKSIWRTTLDGTGYWSLDGVCEPEARSLDVCRPSEVNAVFEVVNTGSVPVTPYIAMTSNGHCDLFDVSLIVDGDPLASGPLCGLLAEVMPVADQLDPDDTLEILVSVKPAVGGVEPGRYVSEMTIGIVATQWNLPLPEADNGWTATADSEFELDVAVEPPPAMDCSVEPPVVEPPVEEPPVEEPPVEEPPVEEPPVEEPPVEEPPVVEPPVVEPPVVEPPVVESSSITGQVWHDAEADGVFVAGLVELGIDGVTVVLVDRAGFAVDAVQTDLYGAFNFDGIEPGEYRVRFIPPEGFGFSNPQQLLNTIRTDEDLEELISGVAVDLEVEPSKVVVSDVVELDHRGNPTVASTDVLYLEPGHNVGIADAPMVELPSSKRSSAPEDREPAKAAEVIAEPDPGAPEEPPAEVDVGTDGKAKEPEPDPVEATVADVETSSDPATPDEIPSEPSEEVPIETDLTP